MALVPPPGPLGVYSSIQMHWFIKDKLAFQGMLEQLALLETKVTSYSGALVKVDTEAQS